MPILLNAATVRADQLTEVDLGDGTMVRARKLDLSMMLLEGELPLPLLTAARELVANRGEPPDVQLEELDREAILKTLRQHALVVVVEPVIVEKDDHDPTHLPVLLLKLPQLLAIWNQTAVLPKVGAAAAAAFRQSTDVAAADAVHSREDVRPQAEHLAPGEPQFRGV